MERIVKCKASINDINNKIMPTGYTAPIYEGDENFSFEKFALRCARNFVAFYGMRDEPLDAEFDLDSLFEPSEHHKKALEKAECQYREFLKCPPTEESLGKEYDALIKLREKEYAEREWKISVMRARYKEMIRKAEAWTPPTSEHEGLKEFMLQQLKKSLEYDCSPYNPICESREEYIKARITPDYFLMEIEHYKREWDKEVERCESRKKWVMQLIDSLKNIKE